MEFLLFRLSGPMMAFGDITVGERRSLWDAPSKSGVLGLLAASLGLSREDHDALFQLDQSLGFAVRIDRAGKPLRDYHTAQAPTEAARTRRKRSGLSLNTRKEDLECDDLNTVLSERIYRLEAQVTIALWVKPDLKTDLSALATALNRPVHTPYLGRKACPLGAPPRPVIVQSQSLSAAFSAYDTSQSLADRTLRLRTTPYAALDVWFEWDAGLRTEEAMATQVRTRRDALRNRTLWQFSDRQEGNLAWQPMPYGTEDAA